MDRHSIHSPFFFDFYQLLETSRKLSTQYEPIEAIRTKLLGDPTILSVKDLGAGSKVLSGSERKLADIAKTSLAPPQLARLYHQICNYLEAERIVELGTSLGVTTLYLASDPKARVYTFEGSEAIADVALTNFEYAQKKNIHLTVGDLHDTLPDFLQDPAKIDFALMDANHRYEPTMQYFDWLMKRLSEKSIVVVDDIHASPQMEKAWKELKLHQLVYGSVDLFQCGILLFDPDLNRQHFVW